MGPRLLPDVENRGMMQNSLKPIISRRQGGRNCRGFGGDRAAHEVVLPVAVREELAAVEARKGRVSSTVTD